MSGQEENIFNISVYSDNKEQIMNSTDSASEYIILLNEKLQYTVNTLISKTKEQDNVISIQETELDKLETSITYMRGLLKNFVEIRKAEKEIVELTKSLETVYKIHNKSLLSNSEKVKKDVMMILFIYLTTCMFMVTINIISFSDFIFSGLQLIVMGLVVFKYTNCETIYTSICKPCLSVKSTSDKINKKLNEVSELDSGVDYLNEYIDCL